MLVSTVGLNGSTKPPTRSSAHHAPAQPR
jgi:hypothetical protein